MQVSGLRVALPDFRYRAVMDDGTVENEICPVYVATCHTPETLAPDPDEVDDYVWEDWTKFRGDVLEGRRAVSPWCVAQLHAMPANAVAPAAPRSVGP